MPYLKCVTETCHLPLSSCNLFGTFLTSSASWSISRRPFVKRFASAIRPLSVLSVCDVGVLWPNAWMDQDETWHGVRLHHRRHCVRWGPLPPPKKRHSIPQFSAHVCCGQTAGWIRMPLGVKVGFS